MSTNKQHPTYLQVSSVISLSRDKRSAKAYLHCITLTRYRQISWRRVETGGICVALLVICLYDLRPNKISVNVIYTVCHRTSNCSRCIQKCVGA